MNWGAYHVKRAAGFVVLTLLAAPANAVADAREDIRNVAASIPQRPAELPDDPYLPYVPPDRQPPTAPAQAWQRDQFVSVQVNVDADGNNIIGDAANEPSIAVDPTDPNRMAIGWRQFDTINSNFRQAGVGFSQDRGQTWTFAGVLDPASSEVTRSWHPMPTGCSTTTASDHATECISATISSPRTAGQPGATRCTPTAGTRPG